MKFLKKPGAPKTGQGGSSPPRSPPTSQRRRTAVLVDDDMTITELMEAVFIGREWDIHTAYDGLGALRLVNDKKPDLVLLDLMLPDLPGERVIEAVHRGRLSTKVIVITGRYVTSKDFERFEGTVVWVLRKPYPLNDLRELIDWFESGALMTPKLSSVGDA